MDRYIKVILTHRRRANVKVCTCRFLWYYLIPNGLSLQHRLQQQQQYRKHQQLQHSHLKQHFIQPKWVPRVAIDCCISICISAASMIHPVPTSLRVLVCVGMYRLHVYAFVCLFVCLFVCKKSFVFSYVFVFVFGFRFRHRHRSIVMI